MASTVELKRGQRFILEQRFFTDQGYDEKTNIGLAIDLSEKERFARAGAVISERYAPHDFCLNGVYHDIKSSRGKWLSISFRELEFAQAEVAAGRDVIYVVYLQDTIRDDVYSYLGRVSFKQIEPTIKFGSTPYWSLSTVKNNLLPG